MTYSSDIVVQQGDALVTVADVEAYLNLNVPPEERRRMLSDPSRIGTILNTVVLNEWALARAQETGLMDDPAFHAELRQLVARHVRNVYQREHLRAAERESYTQSARERYLSQPERFMGPALYDFDHILVLVNGERSETEAMQRIIEAHNRLLAGEALVSVADEISDDSMAAQSEHRYVDADLREVVPVLTNAMREVALGEPSVPVRSQFGWHIGRLVQRNEPEVVAWEDVQSDLEAEARQAHLEAVWRRQVQQARSLPAVFPPDAVRNMLNHFGIDGFGISEAILIEEMDPEG